MDDILGLHAYFEGKIAEGAAPADFNSAADFLDREEVDARTPDSIQQRWGTLLTNDFRDCDPAGGSGFDPISLICKVTTVEGRPAVKLSDNYAKAVGPAEEIERYRRVFGTEGMSNVPIVT